MKTCSKCGDEKSINEFSKGNDKDGLSYWCKKCVSECSRKYYLDRNEINPDYLKEYYQENKERFKDNQKRYQKNNPEKGNIRMRNWRKNNPNRAKENQKNYRSLSKYKEKRNKSLKLRRLNDPVFRLNSNMSSVIRRSLKGNKNGNTWNKLVGYDTLQLKQHIEAQFKEGMAWDNYGKWHIDHRVPVSLFNITSAKSKGFKKCWALENLQPMWEKDNLKKSNKIFC